MAEIHVASLLTKYESRKAIIAALSPVTGLEATITVSSFFLFLKAKIRARFPVRKKKN